MKGLICTHFETESSGFGTRKWPIDSCQNRHLLIGTRAQVQDPSTSLITYFYNLSVHPFNNRWRQQKTRLQSEIPLFLVFWRMTLIFVFFFWTWIQVLRVQLETLLTFGKLDEMQRMVAINFETTRIHTLWRFRYHGGWLSSFGFHGTVGLFFFAQR